MSQIHLITRYLAYRIGKYSKRDDQDEGFEKNSAIFSCGKILYGEVSNGKNSWGEFSYSKNVYGQCSGYGLRLVARPRCVFKDQKNFELTQLSWTFFVGLVGLWSEQVNNCWQLKIQQKLMENNNKYLLKQNWLSKIIRFAFGGQWLWLNLEVFRHF